MAGLGLGLGLGFGVGGVSAPPPGPTLIIHDNFNRTGLVDGTLPDTVNNGSAWASPGILSGLSPAPARTITSDGGILYHSDTVQNSAYANIEPGVANLLIEVTCAAPAFPGEGVEILTRVQDNVNYWWLRWIRTNSPAVQLFEVVAGIPTVRGSYAPGSVASILLGLKINSDVFEVYTNSVLRFSYTSTLFNAFTRMAINPRGTEGQFSPTGTGRVRDFKVYSL